MSKILGSMKKRFKGQGSHVSRSTSSITSPPPPPEFKINFGPNDCAIAVMGVTGTGKSTFISLFTDEEVGVGHGLASYTAEVGAFSFEFSPGRRVHLIDTPGFDDTFKSDTDVLREIAGYLGIAYRHNIKLSGIIYLHRIVDPRMTGSGMKNLFMFNKLCGKDSLASVVLVTSWWNRIDVAEGMKRERELIENQDFWKGMIARGSKVLRHNGTKQSAWEILEYLINRNRPVTLDIQDQMVNKGQTLDQTSAGRAVQDEISRLKNKFAAELKQVQQDRQEALRARDAETARALKEVEESFTQKLERVENDRKRLHENMENLRIEREREMQKESEKIRVQLETMKHANETELSNKLHEIQTMKLTHSHELEMQAMRNQNERQALLIARYEKEMRNICVVM